jgi:hypothetical protein
MNFILEIQLIEKELLKHLLFGVRYNHSRATLQIKEKCVFVVFIVSNI